MDKMILGAAMSFEVSSECHVITSGYCDEAMRRWDGRSGGLIVEPLHEHKDRVNCVAVSRSKCFVLGS